MAEDNTIEINPIKGVKISSVREMTDEELEREGWEDHRENHPVVLELANGQTIFASKDLAGHGPGTMFGYDTENEQRFYVSSDDE
jgi:hypothetical protein